MNPGRSRNPAPRLLGRAVVGRGLAVSGNLLSRRAGLAADNRSQLLPGVPPESILAGRGVTISGSFVTVKAESVEYPPKKVETWEMWLWAKIYQRTSHGDTETDWQQVARVLRGSPLQASNSLDLQLFDFPGVEGTPADRHEFTVKFEARKHEPGRDLTREDGRLTFPVLVTFDEELESYTGGEYSRSVIQKHRLIVRGGSNNRISFTPQAGGVVTYINIASILRAP